MARNALYRGNKISPFRYTWRMQEAVERPRCRVSFPRFPSADRLSKLSLVIMKGLLNKNKTNLNMTHRPCVSQRHLVPAMHHTCVVPRPGRCAKTKFPAGINLVQTVAPDWRQIESLMALDLIIIPAVTALVNGSHQ